MFPQHEGKKYPTTCNTYLLMTELLLQVPLQPKLSSTLKLQHCKKRLQVSLVTIKETACRSVTGARVLTALRRWLGVEFSSFLNSENYK